MQDDNTFFILIRQIRIVNSIYTRIIYVILACIIHCMKRAVLFIDNGFIVILFTIRIETYLSRYPLESHYGVITRRTI